MGYQKLGLAFCRGPSEGGGDRVGYPDEAWIYGGIRDLQGWRDR